MHNYTNIRSRQRSNSGPL